VFASFGYQPESISVLSVHPAVPSRICAMTSSLATCDCRSPLPGHC
jgi:hypothetical protein